MRSRAGAEIGSPSLFRPEGPAPRLFVVLCLLWLLPRFLPAPSRAPAAVVSVLAASRAAPSPDSGRFELSGLPEPGSDPAGLLRLRSFNAMRLRLEEEVHAVNDELTLAAEQMAGAIETFPDDGVTGIRLAGALVPFYDRDSDRLAQARDAASARPWESLQTVSEILDRRLSEPQEGFQLEEETRRRDLSRILREVNSRLDDSVIRVSQAIETFRSDGEAAAREASGPFRRAGRARILEIVLAALLGVTLREALRTRRPPITPAVVVGFAPVLSAGTVLMLEGSSVLPVDPLRGTSLSFIALSFGLGFGSASVLGWVRRLDQTREERLHEGQELTPSSVRLVPNVPTPTAPSPYPEVLREPSPRSVPAAPASSEIELPEERPHPEPQQESPAKSRKSAAGGEGTPREESAERRKEDTARRADSFFSNVPASREAASRSRDRELSEPSEGASSSSEEASERRLPFFPKRRKARTE